MMFIKAKPYEPVKSSSRVDLEASCSPRHLFCGECPVSWDEGGTHITNLSQASRNMFVWLEEYSIHINGLQCKLVASLPARCAAIDGSF